MLENLIAKLAAAPLKKVPPVPSPKNMGEPLQATNGAAVPQVPPVKTETKTNNKTAGRSAAETSPIKCGDCLNFKCFNAHGKGAGHCLVGAKDRLWSDQERDCESYRLKVAEGAEPKTIIVTCYIPNGNPVKVQAASEEYADWLIKMNPKPKRKP